MSFVRVGLYMLCSCYISGFGLPSELLSEPQNPHCSLVTWNKAGGPVSGYRLYIFPDDSQKAEIVKDIHDMNQVSAIISGLKPETMYRVGITSVSSGIESNQVFSKEQLRMRKSVKIL